MRRWHRATIAALAAVFLVWRAAQVVAINPESALIYGAGALLCLVVGSAL